MIARTWNGVVLREKADAYAHYLNQTGVADCHRTPGNQGVHVLRRDEGDRSYFLFISFWESEAVIRAFAGDDIERARYYPEDTEFLLELEPTVTHYQVVSPTDHD